MPVVKTHDYRPVCLLIRKMLLAGSGEIERTVKFVSLGRHLSVLLSMYGSLNALLRR